MVNKSAFSVVEVSLVILVIATTLSFGAIRLNKYLQRLHLNQATTEFVAGLRRASDDALRFSRRITIEESYLGLGKLVWSSSDGEFARIELPFDARISYVNKNQPGEQIWFSGRGLPYQQVEFGISLDDNNMKRVVLLPTGLVIQK